VSSFHLNVKLLRDQRGVALPMALLALLILSTLVISFALLATSEPLIATNQKLVAQARAVTESGVERAIWALNNPADPNGLPLLLPAPAPAPYDGSAPIPISVNGTQIGEVFVTVTNGTNPANERNIVAVGWVPTSTGSGSKAHQKIQVTVSKFFFTATPPPASLTVQGQINITGNTNIDSRADQSCGPKDGTWSVGSTTVGGSGDVYGADGNNTENQLVPGANGITDVKQNVPIPDFAPFILKNQEANKLSSQVTELIGETTTQRGRIDTLQKDLDTTKRDLTAAQADTAEVTEQKKIISDCVNAIYDYFAAVAKANGQNTKAVQTADAAVNKKCDEADKYLAPAR